MRTIADTYIEEGIEKGIKIGEQKGMEKGMHKAAMNMLNEGIDVKFITKITGISEYQLLKLKNKL